VKRRRRKKQRGKNATDQTRELKELALHFEVGRET
jgi:hypothetical protein